MMATYSTSQGGFYDDTTNASPRTHRNPQLTRQSSRPLDAYGTMQGSLFNNNNMPSLRFDNARDSFGTQMSNTTHGNNLFPYDTNAAQTWSSSGGPMHNFSGGIGGMPQTTSFGTGIKSARGRPGVSSLWGYDQQPGMSQGHASLHPSGQGPLGRNDSQSDDDELIPTAIVIKNIPFAVKKEQLVQLMVDMNLPLPYAFNYHFDNGVFRGLAFANFTSPQETEQVIQALNHMDLSGRKLRVEYKKMLPLAERERIEREKRERRGQLEEQHRPLPQSGLQNQISISSIPRNTPSPLSQHPMANQPDVDMNDGQTLEYYTEIQLFRRDTSREVLILPPMEPHNRRIVHVLAHRAGLMHTSYGNGEQRQVHLRRPAPGTNVSPPSMTGNFVNDGNLRQNLGRASAGDYADSRMYDGPGPNTLRGQSSVGLLDVLDPNGLGGAVNSNLRNAKSFADLRSWSPSPVPSTASFPTALQTNGARLQALNDNANSNPPNLTPTTSTNPLGGGHDEPFLISGIKSMSLGPAGQTSPRRQRSFFTANSTWEDGANQAPPPIGSKRSVTIGADPTVQDRLPLRQSRGPSANGAAGFRRQNGRGSDELRNAASAIAE